MRGLDFDDRADSDPLTAEEKAVAMRAVEHMRAVILEFVDALAVASTVGDLRASEAIIDKLDAFDE